MNKERLKKLNEIDRMVSLALDDLRDIADEEQEAFDNMPEGLQEGERGQKIRDNADNLQQLCDDLENVQSSIQEMLPEENP